MTSLTLILLVLSVICSSVAIHLQKECEARSELEISYEWSTIDINVWMPRGNLSFLTIEIEFENYNFPKVYDSIEVSRNNIKVKFYRDVDDQTDQHDMNETIPEGWTDITLSFESSYGLTYHNHNISLPRKSLVDFFPKLIRLKGSNVTINCPLGQRMWKISDKRVYLPIESSEPQSFYVFSVREFLPNMFIESRKIPLGYADGKYTTIESRTQKLPASGKHDLVITCYSEMESICIVKFGSTRFTEEVRVGHVPKSISFISQGGGTFYLIHQDNLFDKTTDTEKVYLQQDIDSTTVTGKDVIYIVIIVILLLSLIFVIIFNHRKGRNNINATKRKKDKGNVHFSGITKKKDNERDVETGSLLKSRDSSTTLTDNERDVEAGSLLESHDSSTTVTGQSYTTGRKGRTRKRSRKSKSDPTGMFSRSS